MLEIQPILTESSQHLDAAAVLLATGHDREAYRHAWQAWKILHDFFDTLDLNEPFAPADLPSKPQDQPFAVPHCATRFLPKQNTNKKG